MERGYIKIKENETNQWIVEAKLVNCTLWLSKHEMANLFNVFLIYTTEKPIGIANVYEGDEAKANAKLIAAAPEMLKAIIKAKEIMETVRKYMPKSIKNSDRYEFENANAAIGNAIYKATK